MDVALLEQIDPATLSVVLPQFLAGFVAAPEAAGRTRDRIAALVAGWSPEELRAIHAQLQGLGAEYRVYDAEVHCRQLSRAWCRDVILEPALEGVEHLRAAADAGPVALLGNHLSYVDTTAFDYVLAAAGHDDLADRVITVAGPKVYTDVFRRVAAAGLSTLPAPQSTSFEHTAHLSPRELARRALASQRAGRTAMEQGRFLQIYPEGSRSRSGRLQPFLRGVHRYLHVDDLCLVPVAIEGTDDVFPVEATRLSPAPVRLTFGAPLALADHDDARDALGAAHAAVAALLPDRRLPDPDSPRLR